jgi:hypothetical protein
MRATSCQEKFGATEFSLTLQGEELEKQEEETRRDKKGAS